MNYWNSFLAHFPVSESPPLLTLMFFSVIFLKERFDLLVLFCLKAFNNFSLTNIKPEFLGWPVIYCFLLSNLLEPHDLSSLFNYAPFSLLATRFQSSGSDLLKYLLSGKAFFFHAQLDLITLSSRELDFVLSSFIARITFTIIMICLQNSLGLLDKALLIFICTTLGSTWYIIVHQ